MMKRILLSLLQLLALTAWAQPTCSVRTFSLRDGLAANTISGIGQSSDGLMWIATWNGLCCYDGYQFTTFRSDSWADADALSSNRISMIKPDSHENVWVRTYDGGLYLLDTRQCRFVNVGLLLEHKYGKEIRPRNFYALPSGHTWVTDERGELNLRIDDRYPTDVECMEVIDLSQHPRAGHYIRKVDIDDKGRERLTTDAGIVYYGHWDAVHPLPSPDDDVNQSDTAFTRRLAVCGIMPSDIEKHFIDQQGNLWLTSMHGLTLVNFVDSHMQWKSLVEGQETRSLLCRRDGSLWAGTKDGYIGVFYSDGQLRGWLNTTGQVTPVRSRFADRIYVMKEDSQGRIWIGTKGQGLYVISPQGMISHYMPDGGEAQGGETTLHGLGRPSYSLSHASVYDIDEDNQGNIWIGTYGGGLNLAIPQSDGTLRFLHSGNELKGYPMDPFSRIRRITHTPQGVILLSCTDGLVTFSNSKRKLSDQSSECNIAFYCTQHHRQDTTSLRTNDVLQTLTTRDGNVYTATEGGGIQRVTSDNLLRDSLHFQLVTVLNRGSGNSLSLTEDGQGNIWITREAEVCRFTPATGHVERISPQLAGGEQARTGWLSGTVPELTEAQPALDQSGRLWIAALGGLFCLDTREIQKSRFQPHIIFTSVLFQGEQEPHPILNRGTLTVGKEQRNMTVRFAALEYGDHYLMEYAYRMDDEKEWNYIGSTPRLSFSQLPPGLHTLEVRSTNGDGAWADNTATLLIDVTPTLWERTWLRLLLLLLVIALATIAVVSYIRHRQRTREREQRLESILHQYRELQQSVAEQQAAADRPAAATPHSYQLEQPQIVDADQEMMQQLMKFIEEHVSDDGLRIEDMAQAVGLGRSVFYEKVKHLVGVSPVDFLRQLRMQRAMQLISHSTMNVSQVAYAVGFTDPKYFSRCFKKETGMTPREYRDKNEG